MEASSVTTENSAQNSNTIRSTYTHEPLLPGANFRVLILEPGATEETLRCTLRTASLDSPPSYECISYVWEKPDRVAELLCDAKHMSITSSLDRVLRRVRLTDRRRTIWVDSVCINQEDLEEKSCQVALMSDIYRQSNPTLICISEDSRGNAATVQAILSEVDNKILGQKLPGWNTLPAIDNEDPILKDQRWGALKPLSEATWFTRGWCVQEAALAKAGRILWGSADISWSTYMRVIVWMLRRANQVLFEFELGFSHLHVSAFCINHKEDVQCLMPEAYWQDIGEPLDTFHSARELGLTVPHDRIYAFLGLPQLTDRLSLKIVPDYVKPFGDVCKDFARSYLTAYQDLDLLLYVTHGESIAPNHSSWAPDWMPEDFPRQDIEGMYAKRPPLCEIDKSPTVREGELHIQALIFSQIQYVSEPLKRDIITMASMAKLWSEVSQVNIAKCPAEVDRTLMFAAALVAAITRLDTEQHFRDMAAFLLEVHKRNGSQPEVYKRWLIQSEGGDAESFVQWIALMAENRRLVVSERGYGLGPLAAQPGDECAIILGAKCPFILRRTVDDGKSNCYQLIGTLFQSSQEEFEHDETGEIRGVGLGDGEDWRNWDVKAETIILL